MLRRSIITIILTLGLSLTIARYVGWQLITYTPDLPELLNRMNAAVILMPIVFLLLGLILPSSWLIEDTNIVFHSQGSSGPQEIRNAGRILMTLLAGYFGISIIIDYLNLIALTPDVVLSWITHSWPWVPLPFFFIITYINPFIYIFWPLLALLVYYRYLPSLQNHLIGYMDSLDTQTISKMAVIDVDISEYLGEKETTNSD